MLCVGLSNPTGRRRRNRIRRFRRKICQVLGGLWQGFISQKCWVSFGKFCVAFYNPGEEEEGGGGARGGGGGGRCCASEQSRLRLSEARAGVRT